MIKLINKLLLFLIPAVLLLTGCQNANANVEVITFKPSEYEIVLIPQNSTDQVDDIYANAIIELKAKYPYKFKDIKAVEKNIDEINTRLHADSPTLLIMRDGKTIKKISGNLPKEEIKSHLEHAIDG